MLERFKDPPWIRVQGQDTPWIQGLRIHIGYRVQDTPWIKDLKTPWIQGLRIQGSSKDTPWIQGLRIQGSSKATLWIKCLRIHIGYRVQVKINLSYRVQGYTLDTGFTDTEFKDKIHLGYRVQGQDI